MGQSVRAHSGGEEVSWDALRVSSGCTKGKGNGVKESQHDDGERNVDLKGRDSDEEVSARS